MLTSNYSSKSAGDRCPFKKQSDCTNSETKTESDKPPKTCHVFFTDPHTKKSVCEQRRERKCILEQRETDCKMDEGKCKGLGPDCRRSPEKEVPGRDDSKDIPGCAKTGWQRNGHNRT